jgi:hypothetical protein
MAVTFHQETAMSHVPGRRNPQSYGPIPVRPHQESAMSPQPRPFPNDDYHPHVPDADGDYMVLLMAVAALIPAPPDRADEPVVVRAGAE